MFPDANCQKQRDPAVVVCSVDGTPLGCNKIPLECIEGVFGGGIGNNEMHATHVISASKRVGFFQSAPDLLIDQILVLIILDERAVDLSL
jgi:hypothetical protein